MSVAESEFVDDATIEAMIDEQAATDLLSIGHVRAVLRDVQEGTAETWGEHCERIKSGGIQLLAATGDYYILQTSAGGELDLAIEHAPSVEQMGDEQASAARDVVRAIHHEIAGEHTDTNWGYSDPLVVGMDGLSAADGALLVESYVNGLIERGASPGQAWSYYGVEIRGHSQSEWGRRQGRTQSQVQKGVAAIGSDELGY